MFRRRAASLKSSGVGRNATDIGVAPCERTRRVGVRPVQGGPSVGGIRGLGVLPLKRLKWCRSERASQRWKADGQVATPHAQKSLGAGEIEPRFSDAATTNARFWTRTNTPNTNNVCLHVRPSLHSLSCRAPHQLQGHNRKIHKKSYRRTKRYRRHLRWRL